MKMDSSKFNLDFLKSRYLRDFDTRLSIKCNSKTKESFYAACEFMKADSSDVLDLLLRDYVSKVLEYAEDHSSGLNDLLFDDARRILEEGE